MKYIPLTQGKQALVDNQDFKILSKWKWYFLSAGYAARDITVAPGKKKTILMHRQILETPKGMQTDHMNNDGLDNRRGNLRVATNWQNHGNIPKQKGIYSSIYKGITWWKRDKNWKVQIMVNNRNYNFGYFSSEKEAAHIYNQVAGQVFGEFAKLNDI